MKTIIALVCLVAITFLALSDELPIQSRGTFKQDPSRIDLPEEAITRAKEILKKEEQDVTKHPCTYEHDFFAPLPIEGFAKKMERIFIVKVAGYESKDGSPVFRFVWVHEKGTYVWEP